jgi:hypothetical protein
MTTEDTTAVQQMDTDYDAAATQISTSDESDAKADELTALVDMVRAKKPAPAAKVAAAPKTKGKAAKQSASPVEKQEPKAEEPKKQADDATRLFQLGKIPPNVRGFRGYARAQIVHLNSVNAGGFTQKQFRDALVNNAAGVEQPGEPTVGWAKHNFPTWCAANAWIVPFVPATDEEPAASTDEVAH